ncbi:penicillin-binding protein activator [Gluconacetobacter diazotrophicus]|uniref:Penicillin-binding protein activator n=1 Tax=Gluconacetobacter diazotrophicus TaxID=33996 RepID=A0A7W4FCZ7_GLUDI|nr:penicillin-binding protein activator [Gluconacetobacter diazotrophicus]MBB2155413.1 penicillin-binding protein activator [Gluconacetobacter diazotrophicus]
MAASLAGLAACAGPAAGPAGPVTAGPPAPAPTVPAGRTVGVLLPLSGGNARLGQEMLASTRLALGAPTAPPLDIRDTEAAGGAGAAAQAAVAAGDGVILGPLTAAETTQAAAVTASTSIPMLAYTSDLSLGRPGVWALGIAPEQQVERLVTAARAEGRQHFAAFLPDTALGRAMGKALTEVCAAQGLATPDVVYHTTSPASITQGLKTLSAYDTRLAAAQPGAQAPVPPDMSAVDPLGAGAPAVPAPATGQGTAPAAPAVPKLGAPPFDALLLADTGLQLASVIDALQAVQAIGPAATGTAAAAQAPAITVDTPPAAAPVAGAAVTGVPAHTPVGALTVPPTVSTQPAVAPPSPPQQASVPVRILGTGLWGAFAGKLGRLEGAWYAAPDPGARQRFIQIFMARYHHMPTPLSDLSYDSAALVGALDRARPPGQPNGYAIAALTRPDGFSGVDGVFGLTPDGQTLRDLAIFQIQPGGGGRIVSPAARRLVRDQRS